MLYLNQSYEFIKKLEISGHQSNFEEETMLVMKYTSLLTTINNHACFSSIFNSQINIFYHFFSQCTPNHHQILSSNTSLSLLPLLYQQCHHIQSIQYPHFAYLKCTHFQQTFKLHPILINNKIKFLVFNYAHFSHSLHLLDIPNLKMHSQFTNSNILITGCSRGLGFQLLKILCQRNPNSSIIGTVRSQQQQLQNFFNKQFPLNKLTLEKLDISSPSSVASFAQRLKQRNVKLSILVNNSGVYLDEMRAGDIFFGDWADTEKMINSNHLPENLEKTFATNFYGTISLTENLLPLLEENGRIITVSSGMGGLKYHSEEVQQKFRNPEITMQEISQQIKKFTTGAPNKNFSGFMPNAYATSKMMLNAWNRYMLPKKLRGCQSCIGMSPGFCKTDMGGEKAYRSARDGAQSIYKYLNGNYSNQVFYHESDPCSYQYCHP